MLEYNIEKNLRILSAMAANLVPYLYEDELFGQLEGNMPKLTVGGVLLRLHQLGRLWPELSAGQQAQFTEARQVFEAMRSQWRVHYEQKVLQELKSRSATRLRYLQDSTDPTGDWPNEIEKRTIIAHLEQEASQLDILTDELAAAVDRLDLQLRQMFRAGAFFWDPRLESAYPREEFWWLYGAPEEREE